MKYRKLTKDELEVFEKEFIQFLVINGITADEWLKIKLNQKPKAERIIEQFSDVIFESVLRKTKYIDFIAPHSIKCFQFLNDKVVMVGVDAPKDSKIDFTSQLKASDYSDLEVYTTSKPYQKERSEELFNLIQAGAQISDGSRFKKLCLLL